MKTGRVVFLHNHRTIPGKPEQKLGKLLERLLYEKHKGDILAASEAYAEEKTSQILAQTFSGVCLDREELYDALIGWALMELGELTQDGEILRRKV